MPTKQHDDQDTRNRSQQDYEDKFNQIVQKETKGDFDDIVNRNFPDDAEGKDLNGKAIDNARETEMDGTTKGTWDDKTNSQGKNNWNRPKLNRALTFAKKRGGVIGLIAIFGISGGILASFLGPASMLISLTENLTDSNDTSSTVFERRFLKVFSNMTAPTDPICATSTSVKCSKLGRISNSALVKLEKKGVVAYFDDGSTFDGKKTGYPAKNPKGYTFDLGNGRTANVAAGDLVGYLQDNPKDATKVLGRAGAFNLKLKAWTGKYITTKLFAKFSLSRTGGLADGTNERLSSRERVNATLTKLIEKIPGLSNLNDLVNGFQDKIKTKISASLGKYAKGGAAYTAAVAGCIAVKAPAYIAAGVAGIQLAQVMAVVMDTTLSPGSKLKASGVDTANSVTSEDMDAIGTMFTATTPDESGVLTSALDSAILLSALGVNKNKVAISQDFTPGYSVLNNPIVTSFSQADEATQSSCNVIMSPAAMYSALAVDAAVTVAASATVIGGIIKAAASFAVAALASAAAAEVAGALAGEVIKDLADNPKVATAKGKAFGDLVGVGALSFFASGGLSRNLPVMKMSQLKSFTAVKQENEEFQRQMDIASLSPFDTSSKYTFLGNIAYNMRLASITSGSTTNTITSFIGSVFRMPSYSFSPTASAATSLTEFTCGYAAEFGLESTTEADTPAINAAGLPCTGITEEQASMSTEQAINLLINAGWVNEAVSVTDTATIEDLVNSGYIVTGTPLADYIESCGYPETGDYLFNSASCTISSTTKDTNEVDTKIDTSEADCTNGDSGNSDCDTNTGDYPVAQSSEDNSNATLAASIAEGKALTAMPVFLVDFQLAQSLNGEDEEVANTNTVAGVTIDLNSLYDDSTGVACAPNTIDKGTNTGYVEGDAFQIRLCALPNSDEPTKPDGMAIVNSRVSGAAYAMLEQMKTDLAEKGVRDSNGNLITKIPFGDSYRSPQAQAAAIASCGLYKNGGCAAEQGYSNHQSGVALDFEYTNDYCAHTRGIITCPPSPYWTWLNENAAKFSFKNGVDEWWHWSPTGG